MFLLVLPLTIALFSCSNNAKKVTLVLDADGGVFNGGKDFKVINNINVGTKWKDIQGVEIPTKTDFEFTKWQINDQEIDDEYVISEDIVAKSGWFSIAHVTITFDANGGKFDDKTTYQLSVRKGDNFFKAIRDVKHPTLENMAFDYWTLNDKKIDAKYIADSDITVKANYFKPIAPDEISDNGIVLLKNNNNALPLKNNERTINVIGFGGSKNGWNYQGNGSGTGTDRGRVVLTSALANEGFNVNDTLEQAYENDISITNHVSVVEDANVNYVIRETDSTFITNRIDSIESNSIALVVFTRFGGEGNDLPKFQAKLIRNDKTQIPECGYDSIKTDRIYSALSEEEENTLNTICSYKGTKFSKIIVLLNCCCPMECGFLDNDKIDAAFYMPMAGNKGPLTVPKVLKGTINPSGHLADTFAYHLDSAPSYANMSYKTDFSDDNRKIRRRFKDHLDQDIHYTCYEENIYIGYYWYETADAVGLYNDTTAYPNGYHSVVQYPFGYGKSYTSFTWEAGLPIPKYGSLNNLNKNDELTFKVKVTNVGDKPGKDVVELYVEKPYKNGIEKPAVQLVGFAKTKELNPQESEDLVIVTRLQDFADYDVYDSNNDGHMGYELDGGAYIFSLRTDAHTLKDSRLKWTTGIAPADSVIHYDEDADTKYEIRNRFTTYKNPTSEASSTNDDHYPNDGRCVSIDGADFNNHAKSAHKGLGAKYLTRKDFAGTMPTDFLEQPYLEDDYNQTYLVQQPWMESDKKAPIENAPGNLTLWDVADKPYNDPLWDKLMDQLSFVEMRELVRDGGFKTNAISRIDKKETIDKDGPCGFANAVRESTAVPTNFPSDSMVACTWDVNMSYQFGKALGYEAINVLGGIDGNYGPGLNLHRSPLGGRNFEYYSEDPLLSGNLCSWQISGAKEEGMYCYVKHVAMNDSDTGRNGRYNFATEQAFRQLYAKPFEIICKGAKKYDSNQKMQQALKANAMMASVDRIGSTRVTGSYNFLTEVIRHEWGFNGTIITDFYQAGNVNDIDEGIRCGNNLMLSGINNCHYDDYASDTFKYYVREAAKGVLYTYINTKYESLIH